MRSILRPRRNIIQEN